MPGQQICLATTAAEDCTDVYVVQPDDTCDGISSMKSLNSTILRLNNPQINEACDNIYVGEVSITQCDPVWLCLRSTIID